jgi:hypothetical protein
MSVDRRAVKVILALCDMELKELAHHLGYEPRYVSNVLCRQVDPSRAFRRAFGETVANLVFGDRPARETRLPAAPLVELIERRAESAPSKRDFYADKGINMSYLTTRGWVKVTLVDRICCALGVHPSSLYGNDYGLEDLT